MDRDLVEPVGPGRCVRIEDQIVRLVRYDRDAGGLHAVVERPDGSQTVMPFTEFCQRTSTITRPIGPDGVEVIDSVDWASLPEDTRNETLELAEDLLEVRTGSRRGEPELDRASGLLNPAYDPALTTTEDRIRTKIAERRAKGLPASRSMLFRSMAALGEGDLLALVHKNRKLPGGGGAAPELLAALREFLASRQDEARVPDSVLATMARAELTGAGHHVSLGSSAWARVVGEAARGLGLHRAARSRSNRRDTPRVPFGRLSVSRPGELVHIDATPSNVHCWFPGLGWARATILTGIDVYDRDIVALRVVPGAVTSRDAALLLWDIGRPSVTRAGWPFNRVNWHGVPRMASLVAEAGSVRLDPATTIGTKHGRHPTTVVLDNGAENRSAHLRSAAARNGIGIIFCPPAAPHTKGIVEAWHNSLDTVQSLLPGYKGANPGNHPRLAELGSVLTAGDLHDALWDWIFTVYRHREHSGLRDPANPLLKSSPADIFERYLQHGGEVGFPTDPWRMIDFLSTKSRLLQDYGLNIDRRIYNSEALQELRSLLQRGAGAKPRPLTVHYDRWDISRVYVRHPVERTWMMIPRVGPHQLAMPPCTELLHHAALAQTLRQERGSLHPDQVQLAEMRLYMNWSRGIFEDRQAQRMAALEASRSAMHAHDLEDATDEYRTLAYPDGTDLPEPPDIQDSDSDNEILAYGDVVVDGFAW